ncbi:hypothetical protein H3146_05820 [Streptomyces sp. OF3]|uniref:Uncharacterized protein n=1 Tax=Streptomyces alkaliterrae TaxID=2213162 RepID=A0A7W3WIE0_9ACTN|nr:hypothetical protein [Streptomyces alkaliterrae]MBB1252884.1 hypothetical protein [Streptomyces alkaliterrae]
MILAAAITALTVAALVTAALTPIRRAAPGTAEADAAAIRQHDIDTCWAIWPTPPTWPDTWKEKRP